MVYQDMLFEARYNEMKHDYAQANAARGHAKPGTLRTLLRRFAK